MSLPDRERAPIIMRRVRSGLTPVSPFDAEMLEAIGMGADVEVKIKQRRSLPQLRLYWSVLHKIVQATDAYPTAERLHEALKMATGHTVPVKMIGSREIMQIPDSVAFSKMSQADFKRYFDKAMELLATLTGSDPLAWMTRDDLMGTLQASLEREQAA